MHTNSPNHSPPRVEGNESRLKWQPVRRRMTVGLVLIVVFTTLHISRPPPTHATTPADTNTEQDTQTTTTISSADEDSTTTIPTDDTNTPTTSSPTGHASTTTAAEDHNTTLTTPPPDDTTSTSTFGYEQPTSTSTPVDQTTTTSIAGDTTATTNTQPPDDTTSSTTGETTASDTSSDSSDDHSRQLPKHRNGIRQSQTPTGTTLPSSIAGRRFSEPSHNTRFNEAYNLVKGSIHTIFLPGLVGGDDGIDYSVYIRTINVYSFDSETRVLTVPGDSDLFDSPDLVVGTLTAENEDDENDYVVWDFGLRGHNQILFQDDDSEEADDDSEEVTGIDDQTFIAGSDIGTIDLPVAVLRSLGTEEIPYRHERCRNISYAFSPSLPSGISFNELVTELSGTPTIATNQIYTFTASISLYPTYRCTNLNSAGQDQSRWIVTQSKSISFRITVERDKQPMSRNNNGVYQIVNSSLIEVGFISGNHADQKIGFIKLGNGTHLASSVPQLPGGINIRLQNPRPYDTEYRNVYLTGVPSGAISSNIFAIRVTDIDGDSLVIRVALSVALDSQVSFPTTPVTINFMTLSEVNYNLEFTGGNQPYFFWITGGHARGLRIDHRTGRIFGVPTQQADRLQTSISVRDVDGDLSSITITINIRQNEFTVGNIGNYEASLSYPISIEAPATLGSAVGRSYSLSPTLPSGLNFNSSNGTISGTATAVSANRQYTISMHRAQIIVGKSTFKLEVRRDLLPSFPYDQFTISPDWRVGKLVDNFQLPKAVGGDPYIEDGNHLKYEGINLPSGFTIDQREATISGTPTSSTSNLTFQIRVKDRDLDYDTMTINVVVDPKFSRLFLDSIAIVTIKLERGREIGDVILPEASEGNGNYTYEIVPELISGLSFNDTTRSISGETWIQFTSLDYDYIVTDGNGEQDFIPFTIQTVPRILRQERMFFYVDVINQFRYDLDHNITDFNRSNRDLGYSFFAQSPSWLTLNSTDNTINGTPPISSQNTDLTIQIMVSYNDYDYSFEIEFHIRSFSDPQMMTTYHDDFDYDRTIVAWDNEPFAQKKVQTIGYRKNVTLQIKIYEVIGTTSTLTNSLTAHIGRNNWRSNFQQRDISISGLISHNVAHNVTRKYRLEFITSNGGLGSTSIFISSTKRVPSFVPNTTRYFHWPQNSQIETQLPQITDPDNPVTYSLSPDLPDGLSFDNTQVKITGSAAIIPESAKYELLAEDIDEDRAIFAFSAGTSENLIPAFDAIPNRSYQFSVNTNSTYRLPEAVGGNGPLTYRLSSNTSGSNGTSILSQIRYDPSSHSIIGTPSSAVPSTTMLFTATDSDGSSTSIEILIAIESDYEVSFRRDSGQELTGRVGSNFHVPWIYLENRGNGQLDYSIEPSLPIGVTITLLNHPSSRLTHVVPGGVPTVSQSRSRYTITVTDSDGDTASHSFFITIHS